MIPTHQSRTPAGRARKRRAWKGTDAVFLTLLIAASLIAVDILSLNFGTLVLSGPNSHVSLQKEEQTISDSKKVTADLLKQAEDKRVHTLGLITDLDTEVAILDSRTAQLNIVIHLPAPSSTLAAAPVITRSSTILPHH